MRTLFVTILSVCLISLSVLPVHSETKPFGVALFNPIQYPSQNHSIKGVRVTAVYSQHRDLTGLDLGVGFPVNTLTGTLNGIQLGVYNEVGGFGQGIQWGVVNNNLSDFEGLQFGAVNMVNDHVSGVQTGLFNQAHSVKGIQFGLVNITDSLHGVQIGVGNIKEERGRGYPHSSPHKILPLANWTF